MESVSFAWGFNAFLIVFQERKIGRRAYGGYLRHEFSGKLHEKINQLPAIDLKSA